MVDAIAAFWAWWPGARAELERVAGGERGPEQPFTAMLAERVSAMHPDLAWEIGPGSSRRFAFCVTAAGNPPAREAAARWLLAAPEEHDWEFLRSRPAVPELDFVLRLGAAMVKVSDIRFQLGERADEELVDVTVDERSLRGLTLEQRQAAAFLALDHVLGEADVERFLGNVDLRPVRWRTQDARELRAAVQRLAVARAEREARGDELFAFMRGEKDGMPCVITAYTSVRSVDHPLKSAHAAVEIALVNPTELGLTTDAEAEVQNALEDELGVVLGSDGLAVARETGGGRRLIHVYLDPQSDAPRLVSEWCSDCETRSADVEIRHEPGWDSVMPFGLR
jgi:Family of unknown function (DUF695)